MNDYTKNAESDMVLSAFEHRSR